MFLVDYTERPELREASTAAQKAILAEFVAHRKEVLAGLKAEHEEYERAIANVRAQDEAQGRPRPAECPTYGLIEAGGEELVVMTYAMRFVQAAAPGETAH